MINFNSLDINEVSHFEYKTTHHEYYNKKSGYYSAKYHYYYDVIIIYFKKKKFFQLQNKITVKYERKITSTTNKRTESTNSQHFLSDYQKLIELFKNPELNKKNLPKRKRPNHLKLVRK